MPADEVGEAGDAPGEALISEEDDGRANGSGHGDGGVGRVVGRRGRARERRK